MTLEELKQVKTDFDNGIMISRATWARVLDAAIEGANLKEHLEKQAAQNCRIRHEAPNDPQRFPPGMEPSNPYVNPVQEYGSVGDLFRRIFG